MSDKFFNEVYLRRLNRYGTTHQSRIQNKRELEFESLLAKSVYRTQFDYKNKTITACCEPDKQDETQVTYDLFTRVTECIEQGEILFIPDKRDGGLRPWLVWYQEDVTDRGYNGYKMLRMTHEISWVYDGHRFRSYAYLYGQQDNMLKNEIKSRSRMDALYAENLKSSFLIMPRNEFIKQEILIQVGEPPFLEHYRVTGYDFNSSLGVEYVTIDPTYQHDLTAPPQRTEEDKPDNKEPFEEPDEFYWLDGGEEE